MLLSLKNKISIIFLISVMVSVMPSCKKEEIGETKQIPNNNFGKSIQVNGIVIDETGQRLSGVRVVASLDSNNSVITDSYGKFTMNNVLVKDDCVQLRFSKIDYAPLSWGKTVTNGSKLFTEVQLTKRITIGSFDAKKGGTFYTPKGATMVIPPNSLYNSDGSPAAGQFNVFLTHYDANSDNIESAMPGISMKGITKSGKKVQLETFGAFLVELESKNSKTTEVVKAKPNTIKLCLPIPTLLYSTSPEVIPIWALDNTGMWVEIGEAEKNGNKYCGYIDENFRACNFDRFYIPAIIKGEICGNDKLPASNIKVSVGKRKTFTDDAGQYELALEPNIPFTIVTPFGKIAYSSGLDPQRSSLFIADPINCNQAQDTTAINDSTTYVLSHSINTANKTVSLTFQTKDYKQEIQSINFILDENALEQNIIEVTDFEKNRSGSPLLGKAIAQMTSKNFSWYSKNKVIDGKPDEMAGNIFIERKVNNLPQGKFVVKFRKVNSLEEKIVSARFIVK